MGPGAELAPGLFCGVPSMFGSLEVQVLFREVMAKRKGVVARRGLKGARSKGAGRWGSASPYPTKPRDQGPL
jgi:hypothetical protein